jgi:hypothetical protein
MVAQPALQMAASVLAAGSRLAANQALKSAAQQGVRLADSFRWGLPSWLPEGPWAPAERHPWFPAAKALWTTSLHAR